MKTTEGRRILPVVTLGAEYLAIGHLMRRNILTYKAPPHNAGYDLVCINPEGSDRIIRVQVKSRYQIDCDGQFPFNDKKKTASDYEYLILAFLNIGFYYHRKPLFAQFANRKPVFYTLPKSWVESNLKASGLTKIQTKGKEQELEEYRDERGFELIATELGVVLPVDR